MSEPIQQEQASVILSSLRRHPRVVHQGFVSSEDQLAELRATLPRLLPFRGAGYAGFVPVLDWDHRLPSQTVVLRVYAFYTEDSFAAGTREFAQRNELIEAEDRFPEFDVPDYAGLTADEAYEGELDPATNSVANLRLVSPWRREVGHGDARAAVQVARRSPEFKEVAAQVRRRPDYLGDLEAVSWTPPCESSYDGWTIDVWYLTELDGSVGRGRSFLVDLQRKAVVMVREFAVRSG